LYNIHFYSGNFYKTVNWKLFMVGSWICFNTVCSCGHVTTHGGILQHFLNMNLKCWTCSVLYLWC